MCINFNQLLKKNFKKIGKNYEIPKKEISEGLRKLLRNFRINKLENVWM